jgi:hypothetical protein
MSDAFQVIAALAGAAFALVVCGMAFAFGAAIVCRWLNWAPINTTINIFNPDHSPHKAAAELQEKPDE